MPSVPPRSMYHSSTLAPETIGVNFSRTFRISLLLIPHSLPGTGTNIACGQSFSARAIGIAERTPYWRASHDAEQTTPRLPRRPPTIRSVALPAPSGSTSRATAAKNASASASRILGGGVIECPVQNAEITGRPRYGSDGAERSFPLELRAPVEDRHEPCGLFLVATYHEEAAIVRHHVVVSIENAVQHERRDREQPRGW